MFYCIVLLHIIGHYHAGNSVNIINRQVGRLLRQINDIARNILHTNVVYRKASADVKILTFFWKK